MTGGTIICPAIEKVIYGQVAAQAIASEADRLKAKRVFILASESLSVNTDEIDKIIKELGTRFAGLFQGMPPNAPRTAVLQAAAQAGAANTDLLVTVGGGSVTDAGKVMLICMKFGLKRHDDLEAYRIRVGEDGTVIKPDYDAPDVRMVAVPTTLSGGEFNSLGGVTDETRKIKQGYVHRMLAPITVILDPALTMHTPDWLWYSTGIRSLDHAMETLGSFQSNDFADGMAESAIRLLVDGLGRVRKDVSDLEGRLRCQIGVWQSMLPLVGGVPMGASHAIGHTLGGTADVPHGYTSCVMAPYVLQWNQAVNADRQKMISRAFGAPEKPAHVLADEFIRKLGMPRSLRDVGIEEKQLELIADYAMEDFWTRTNPRPISRSEDIYEILRMAL
ncbi:iron-containing alcohol dehydrogenase [Stutzerimonas stutzeri]|uniref:iron-containing alcohol dehydrogenase n=1 Tax=Stutzerimonas stutzeri TaxID=316 RepID=UPI00210D839D|nr:iron-containing alcohol dehydrogenase [Stutzerimonas stutzeri]MCQ4322627.1 iron-containing alcohol dehydrogenase [Stutzerimonas stutzeri]